MKTTKWACLTCALLLAGLAGARALREKWTGVERPGRERPAVDDRALQADVKFKRDVAIRRMDGKYQVTLELIAGRIDLPEAAARFKELNESPPECPLRYECMAYGNTQEERL